MYRCMSLDVYTCIKKYIYIHILFYIYTYIYIWERVLRLSIYESIYPDLNYLNYFYSPAYFRIQTFQFPDFELFELFVLPGPLENSNNSIP